MEQQNDQNELFDDVSDEPITLEEEIPLDGKDDGEPVAEKRFGMKNLFFLFLILLLSALTIVIMIGAMNDDESKESYADSTSDTQSVLENSESSFASADFSNASDISKEVSDISIPEDTSEPEEEFLQDFHGWIINNMGYTYLYYGIGVEQFNYSDATLRKYVDSLRALETQIPEGINVYCMPVPTQIGFLYGQISNSIKQEDNFYNSLQSTFIDSVEEHLNGSMQVVNLYSDFAEKYGTDTQLYYNTDSNWTSDAAYLAYRLFCEASGNAAVTLEAYEAKEINGFLGTFYTATDSEYLKMNADTFKYYKNAATDACTVTLYSGSSVYKNYSLVSNTVSGVSSAYNMYLGTAGQHFKINTTCTSGKKLLVVGDCSAAAMMPFLIANYTEIHYIDVALYKDEFGKLFQENAFTDVIFMSYATNAVKGSYPTYLETMAGIQQNG